MSPHSRNVLVTGGAGFIGSHTAKALARAGYQPVVVDDLRTGHRSAVRWGPFVEAKVSDQTTLRQVFQQYRIGAVIHFAASAYVGESMRVPDLYFRNNVGSTLDLLEVMLEAGIQKIVFSSSCATYGIPQTMPIDETHIQRPVNPYGESKLMCERLLHWYENAYGLSWMALRYFNAAGADVDGDLGEEHEPETHLIPLVIGAAMGLIPHLQIFGTDYPTPDGTAIRDYIHVGDLGEAHVAALRYLDEGGASTALNLGTGLGHSVAQVLSMVEKLSGQKVPTKLEPRRPGDPACLIAEGKKAGRILGWYPVHSSLETIVKNAWDWKAAQRAVS
jgi:UDP-arabinose 4-epimerase